MIGESYGGYLARAILTSEGWSEQIAGLMLLCPVVVTDYTARQVPSKKLQLYDRQFLSYLEPGDREVFCAYAVVSNQITYKRYPKEMVSGVKMAKRDALEQLEQKYAVSWNIDRQIHEKGYDKQTLFITDRQDNCVDYQDLWNMIEDYPRATFAVLDVAGHNLQLEQPKLFHSLVEGWLARTTGS